MKTEGQSSDLLRRTARHYDRHPFEFLSNKDLICIESFQPEPFIFFVREVLGADQRGLEVGCGPGRGTSYLQASGFDVVAVDLSITSIKLARERAASVKFVQANNLELPFSSECFEFVVSDGVVHHTPDAKSAFMELCRVCMSGGHIYLCVYRRRGYYFYFYNIVGPALRFIDAFWLGHLFVWAFAFLPYYLVHLLKTRGSRSYRGAMSFFYDFIITPRASFHDFPEVEDWSRLGGATLIKYFPKVGNSHAFIFRKSFRS